ncbi:5-oxoprolinase subunit PxpB [Heliorestis convoluta]|uniref:Allophanate hydrolase subunit 1 n=1 Tax=Heliorestis convoluta TaxID=356322 RepID=A0A5Q2N3R6_9FIRM|nr:5-oxoprolinase subunit PxpB [Heliorestis convoluta]QGG48533.1 Allophanate hydrolase subunit 1 [Heliorestis convoluta]
MINKEMKEKTKIVPMGDTAWVIYWPDKISPTINEEVQKAAEKIRKENPPWLIEAVPTFSSLALYYDCLQFDGEEVKKIIAKQLKNLTETQKKEKKEWEIPVCYGGSYGLDLENLSREKKLTKDEIIKLHTQKQYIVYMLGFIPGFCYLGDVDERIASPRLATPRKAVPAGSVGIAGQQTGIYPVEAPGGWQIIGRTPIKMYNPEDGEPVFVQAGDYIKFRAIAEEEFNEWKVNQRGPVMKGVLKQ